MVFEVFVEGSQDSSDHANLTSTIMDIVTKGVSCQYRLCISRNKLALSNMTPTSMKIGF